MIVFCPIYYNNLFWFNIRLAKKSCRWQIFTFMQNVTFLFLSFLNLGAQIRCLQNRYTNLKSAVDQPLMLLRLLKCPTVTSTNTSQN